MLCGKEDRIKVHVIVMFNFSDSRQREFCPWFSLAITGTKTEISNLKAAKL